MRCRAYACIGLMPSFYARQWAQRQFVERPHRHGYGLLPRMHKRLPVRGLHTGIWTRGCSVRFRPWSER